MGDFVFDRISGGLVRFCGDWARGAARVAAALAVLTVAAVAAPVGAGPAFGNGTSAPSSWESSFTLHRWSGTGGPARDYRVFKPSGDPSVERPLLVYLHGCSQSAADVARGTKFNQVAEARGFLVAYPEQPQDLTLQNGNGLNCWNWFNPDHQKRGSGEPASIAGITREVMTRHAVDRKRVYVMGMSAGGDMAAVMAATYPDLYAALGIVAGCAYATCTDVAGSATLAAMGVRARVMPTFVVQGTADTVNPFALGETAVHNWLGLADRVDNGAADGSVRRTPASSTNVGFDESALPDGSTGDHCLTGRERNWPCPSGLAGWETYPHTIERYADGGGCGVLDFWIIHGLEHSFPNGDPSGRFTDPAGPDIANAAWDFMLANHMGSYEKCRTHTTK